MHMTWSLSARYGLMTGFFLLSQAMFPASPALANKIYVSNEKGNTVTVIDSGTWEQVTEWVWADANGQVEQTVMI